MTEQAIRRDRRGPGPHRRAGHQEFAAHRRATRDTSVYDPANVANARGLGAGEVITNINLTNGLIATWMFC